MAGALKRFDGPDDDSTALKRIKECWPFQSIERTQTRNEIALSLGSWFSFRRDSQVDRVSVVTQDCPQPPRLESTEERAQRSKIRALRAWLFASWTETKEFLSDFLDLIGG